MFLCISIPFYLFCIFIPTSRHPVWNYWRNLPHHSALSVFCLFTICFKNFSKVFLFNFQIKNICKSIISAQFKAADVVRPIDMIAWIACPWFSSKKKRHCESFLSTHPSKFHFRIGDDFRFHGQIQVKIFFVITNIF